MDFNAFLATLPLMGKGMLGIFIVTGIVIMCMYLLCRLTAGENEERKEP